MRTEVLILDALRTPRARVRRDGGSFADIAPADLLATVLRELTARGLDDKLVDDLVIGVNTAVGDQGGDVARIASMAAGWCDTVPAGTVSRLCCSGLDAVGTAAGQIASGASRIVVAGGVESMSRVPMLADKPTFACDTAVGKAAGFVPIGLAADATAIRAEIDRATLDTYGARSQQRAAAAPAWQSIVPVPAASGELILQDEGARPETTVKSLAKLEPLFANDPQWEVVDDRLGITSGNDRGRHTVGTAPQFADAASALVLASANSPAAKEHQARGRVLGWAHSAVRSPGLEATVPASHRALAMAGKSPDQLSLVEVNESFAVTPLLLQRELGVSMDIVNPNGGAIAVGHPLGACGGVLIANALDQLERLGGGTALVAIPAALGLASAVVIESV